MTNVHRILSDLQKCKNIPFTGYVMKKITFLDNSFHFIFQPALQCGVLKRTVRQPNLNIQINSNDWKVSKIGSDDLCLKSLIYAGCDFGNIFAGSFFFVSLIAAVCLFSKLSLSLLWELNLNISVVSWVRLQCYLSACHAIRNRVHELLY